MKAYRWLSSALAADPNSHWAQQNRDVIWQQMTPEERADGAADGSAALTVINARPQR